MKWHDFFLKWKRRMTNELFCTIFTMLHCGVSRFFRSPSCMYTTRQSTNKKLMKMTIKWWSIDITVITGFMQPIINKRYCTIIYSVSGFCIKTQHGQKL